jgi:hypothetical protein
MTVQPQPRPSPLQPVSDEELARQVEAHNAFWNDPGVRAWIAWREQFEAEVRERARQLSVWDLYMVLDD